MTERAELRRLLGDRPSREPMYETVARDLEFWRYILGQCEDLAPGTTPAYAQALAFIAAGVRELLRLVAEDTPADD